MKSLVSRESHRPSQRYSGVYHIQGAMVTDADLNERSQNTRERTDNLGDDTIKDGVPATDGAVAIASNGSVALREGVIYADGVRGVLKAVAGANLQKPLDIFDAQADLPFGPKLPAGQDVILYADIWERPVFPLEDPYLADPGLHGAVTGFRTCTMTQIKAAPVAALSAIEAGTGAFPRIGSAVLKVTPLNAEILADACDPCAEVVSAEQTVANTLWRLEVISIAGTPDNPGQIVLAWSEENAAEIAPAKVSSEVFARSNKVYEFFSPTTESRAGVYANASDARLPAFVDDLSTNPVPAKDYDGKDWPFVRRWDGAATIDTVGGSVTGSQGGGFTISASGLKITLRVNAFEAELDIANAAVVPGDYWLVEMRRHAAQNERIRLVQPTPVGILHHYCTLMTAKNGEPDKPSDALRRKLSFPLLADLPADHVDFDNNCRKLFGGAENVQQALDNLCAISADDIAFDSKCPAVFDNAKTVQEALDSLCDTDFSIRDSFRLLFDWGVLCGLVPKLVKFSTGQISISAGSFLDRSGRIAKFGGGEFDLSQFEFGKEIVFADKDAFRAALAKGEVCLALAAGDGGETGAYLVPKEIAYGPADRSFAERVRACAEKRRPIDFGNIYTNFPTRQKSIAAKMFLAVSGDRAFQSSAKITRAEFAEAEAVNQQMIAAFKEVANEDEFTLLQERVELARKNNPIEDRIGEALEIRFMQQATAVLQAFRETEQQRLQRCICENLFPPCPPDLGEPPFYVPLACVRGAYDGQSVSLNEVCPYCCRKQAMTWRAAQYFVGDMRERLARQFAKICCADTKDTPKTGIKYDPRLFTAFDTAKFVEQYNLLNTFLDKPQTLPTDYVTKVTVNDLSVKDATAHLKGTGVDVAETIDVNDAYAFDFIQSKMAGVNPADLLVTAGEVRPGDKVGLLVQDGVARGYILLEQGTGKLPFEAAKASLSLSDAEISRATELIRNAALAKDDIMGLEKARDRLVADIGGLKAEAMALEQSRAASDQALKQARDELAQLSRTRETMSTEIAAALQTLEDARKSQEALIGSIRDVQPVTVVVGNENPDLIVKLAGAGVTSIGDIAKLTPATIKQLDRAGIAREADLQRFKSDAETFLRRPIR